MNAQEAQVKIDQMRRVPFEEAAAAWLEIRKPDIDPDTYTEYKRNIATLSRWFAKKKLPAITPELVKDFQAERRQEKYRGQPLTSNTINKEANVLCQMREYIGMAYDKGYKPLPKNKKKIGRALTDQERNHLLYIAKTGPESWRAAYLYAKISLNTGAGPGEVAGIQLFDIDLDNTQIHIRGTKTAGRNRWEHLNEEALEAVIEAQDRCQQLTEKAGIAPCEDHYLFPFLNQKNKKHDPTKPQVSFRRAWGSLVDTAGLPGLRPYDLRHTVATAMLQDPETSKEVAVKIMGHLDEHTIREYEHIQKDARAKALDRLLRRKQKRYTRKPPQSVDADDMRTEVVQQVASMFKELFAQMQAAK